MCNVVLINLPCDCLEDDRLEPQLGLLYIASLLKENDISVQVYEMTGCTTADQIEAKIENIPGGEIRDNSCNSWAFF